MNVTESFLRTIIRNEIINMNEDDQFKAITFQFQTSVDARDAAKILRKKKLQVVEYKDNTIEVHYKKDSQKTKIRSLMDRLPFPTKEIKNKYN